MRDWKKKLSSRKFWSAVIGVVLSIMVIYGSSDEEKTKITGLITACSTLIIYILAESNVDAHHTDTTVPELKDEEEDIQINKTEE
ncbi:MAG: hypothetical protein J6U54_14225 [Clostridiales bacterium]|nr:hypothetical protein [Clostridiales bacterium]